ncbi:HPr family phosphocarrier protein [Metabacillus sp. GX 13764]|uniref:HPr family phosphocarrier protein n=1 Tax=Metabacillus kandeliae TaxID=2900151 RepID=UPI001E289264|nr:HPr family phosphocarrier protein [Metabacillus kandeliae]MCD7036282.1 HPr family phosphocarrier protein [Metabacillus kandeliae]
MRAPEMTIPCEIPSGMQLSKILSFVRQISELNSYILIETNESTVNAKSLLGMSILAAGLKGSCKGTLKVSGPDAELAIQQLENLLSGDPGGQAVILT